MDDSFSSLYRKYASLSSSEKEGFKEEMAKIIPMDELEDRVHDLEHPGENHKIDWKRVGIFALVGYVLAKFITSDLRK